MMEDIQILDTSNEAAEFRTGIEGWVDRHGRFWGKDEHMARWSGCTHIMCPDCNRVMTKNYTLCSKSHEEKAVERYKTRETKPWDGTTPLYSEAYNRYFFDRDEVLEYLDEIDQKAESFGVLRLLKCTPIGLRQIDDDYFCDDLPEEGELPSDVADALAALNDVIREQAPVSWTPGEYAAIIEE